MLHLPQAAVIRDPNLALAPEPIAAQVPAPALERRTTREYQPTLPPVPSPLLNRLGGG
jgi:hypothetical protein